MRADRRRERASSGRLPIAIHGDSSSGRRPARAAPAARTGIASAMTQAPAMRSASRGPDRVQRGCTAARTPAGSAEGVRPSRSARIACESRGRCDAPERGVAEAGDRTRMRLLAAVRRSSRIEGYSSVVQNVSSRNPPSTSAASSKSSISIDSSGLWLPPSLRTNSIALATP